MSLQESLQAVRADLVQNFEGGTTRGTHRPAVVRVRNSQLGMLQIAIADCTHAHIARICGKKLKKVGSKTLESLRSGCFVDRQTKLALTRSKRSWSALQGVGMAEEGLCRSNSSKAAQEKLEKRTSDKHAKKASGTPSHTILHETAQDVRLQQAKPVRKVIIAFVLQLIVC
eukprot:SAG31_NODE_889_length_11203_cov_7.409042_5_plen_171_part_00